MKTLLGLPVVESETLKGGEMVLTDFSRFVVFALHITDENGNERIVTGKLEMYPDGSYEFKPIDKE